MLLVVLPVAAVLGAIGVGVLAEAVSLVVLPEAIINIPVSMYEPTASVGFIVFPVAFVDASVRPNLITLTMSHICLHIPLSLIECIVSKRLDFLSNLANPIVLLILIGLIIKWRQLLSDFLHF